MKNAAWLFFVLGVLAMLLGVYGRFHGATDIGIAGTRFAAGSVLTFANSLFMIGVFLGIAPLAEKK